MRGESLRINAVLPNRSRIGELWWGHSLMASPLANISYWSIFHANKEYSLTAQNRSLLIHLSEGGIPELYRLRAVAWNAIIYVQCIKTEAHRRLTYYNSPARLQTVHIHPVV